MWHGPALLEVLDGVDADRARGAADRRRAQHLGDRAARHRVGRDRAARMQGEATGDPTPEQDWPPVSAPTPTLGAGARALDGEPSPARRRRARSSTMRQLDALVPGLEYPVGVLLARRRRARDVSRRPDRAAEESMTARYFKTAAEFRRWLAAHHATETRTAGRLLQEGVGTAGHQLQGGGRRSAVLRLDRRHQEARRRSALHASLLAAQGRQHLEPRQHQACRGTDRGQARGEARARGLRSGAIRRRPASTRSRTGRRRSTPALERTFKANSGGVGILPRAAARVPAADDVLRDERQASRDAARRLARLIKSSAEGKRIQ